MNQPTFAALLCQAFEGGSRANGLLQTQKLPEGYIVDIVRTLKLAPIQVIAFLWGFAKSSFPGVVAESISLLKRTLPDVTSVADLSDELLQQILHTVAFTSVCIWIVF